MDPNAFEELIANLDRDLKVRMNPLSGVNSHLECVYTWDHLHSDSMLKG